MGNNLLYVLKEVIMQNVVNMILNIILISIPEEAFIVMLIYIFLKRYDLIDSQLLKKSIINILTPALPLAIFFGVFKYLIPCSFEFYTFFPFVILYLFLCLVYFKNRKIKINSYIKIFLAMIISFAIFIVSEMIIFYSIIIPLTGVTEEIIKNSVWLSFFIVLPERILQYFVISLLFLINQFKNYCFQNKLDYNEVYREYKEKIKYSLLAV
jgi:hypothetical protein